MTKLKIESFSKPDCSPGDRLNYIYAFINPESYDRDYKINYENPKIIGDSANTSFFASMGSSQFSLKKLIVDGSGVVPLAGAEDVDDYIDKLSRVVYDYEGILHRPPYLKVTWGLLCFRGVCSSFNVQYKLFKPDGSTLRAYIDLVLTESKDFKTKAIEEGKSSPDLTHKRTVRAGDTLPLMTYKIYGDSAYYTEVARYNGLNSVNSIKPGDEIYFPPLKKQ